MSFQHAAFLCLTLHGMVWIVTLCSQCNHWADFQTCTAAPGQRRPCFCLSKQTLSIFDVKFLLVSNNRQRVGWGDVGRRTKTFPSIQIIHKMNETLLKSTWIWRVFCWTKGWWYICGWLHVPMRHLLYIYMEVIQFTDVQPNWLSRAWRFRSVEGDPHSASFCLLAGSHVTSWCWKTEFTAFHLILPLGL